MKPPMSQHVPFRQPNAWHQRRARAIADEKAAELRVRCRAVVRRAFHLQASRGLDRLFLSPQEKIQSDAQQNPTYHQND